MKQTATQLPHRTPDFDLEEFLPYLLNQAAEATSRSFQAVYAEEYGLTRTQWRVLANLGRFGAMTAKDICTISHIEKTKVSRAIANLEERRLLKRLESVEDRRAEMLSLTARGKQTFNELGRRALEFDAALRTGFGLSDSMLLKTFLKRLVNKHGRAG